MPIHTIHAVFAKVPSVHDECHEPNGVRPESDGSQGHRTYKTCLGLDGMCGGEPKPCRIWKPE